MPGKESNAPEKTDANVVSFKTGKEQGGTTAKKKNRVTVSQVVTYAILALLTLVLVLGVFPSFGNAGSSSKLVFGTYAGKPIEFAYGNYFYRQYQAQAKQASGSSESVAYQIWRAAFENTVFHTAVTMLADAAGIRVANETLNQTIIDSGVYNKDGKFDAETYKNASVEYKNQIIEQYTETLPVQTVLSDMATIVSSDAELDYILSMGDAARSFEYVAFTSQVYPDDLAATYAAANPSLFTQLDVSVISIATEEDAATVLDAVNSGSLSFADAAKQYSQDGFAQDGGRAGVFYLYELQSNFSEAEQVNELFSASAGSMTKAYKSPAGYAVYKVEQAPWIADFTDPQVLGDVKTYIGAKDSGVVTSYLKERAAEFSASDAARLDFASAAKQQGLTVMSVGSTPVNVGSSTYLSGFSYTDSNGYLSAISSDSDAMRILYTGEVGSLTEPLASGSAFLVVRIVGEQAQAAETNDYLRMIYPYLSQSQTQQDLIQAIFGSEQFVDNFLTVFIEKIMGSAT